MTYPLTISGTAMREINRSAVLELIRRESPIARTIISEKLDLSMATVMRIVDELIELGFVRAQGGTEWSGGRRRSLLEFNSQNFLVLGVDMGGPRLYGAVSDLGGSVLDEKTMPENLPPDVDSMEHLTTLISSLLASPKLEGRKVLGIGVGVPGITLHHTGVVQWAYAYHWINFPLKERLSEQFKLPIIVDNDTNLAALGELWFGVGQNRQNIVLVTVDIGIGAGIIIDGALYRGANEASGEIGSMLPGVPFLGRDFKSFGALESMASGTALEKRAIELLNHGDQHKPAHIQADEVFDALRQDESWAKRAVQEMVDYLSVAIANLAVMFDPEIIILGGGIAPHADLLVAPLMERINSTIPMAPRLVVSSLGRRATVMGAITNVLHNTSNFYVVHKLS